jgi:hypothetical protein
MFLYCYLGNVETGAIIVQNKVYLQVGSPALRDPRYHQYQQRLWVLSKVI